MKMNEQGEVKPKPVKSLRNPKEEFLALTTSIDQRLSLGGSLRAVGLTCVETKLPGYVFGSIESITTKHYTTGIEEQPGDELIIARIFDLSRMSFLGSSTTNEAISDDIVANFQVERKEKPFDDFELTNCNPHAFLNCVANKTDRAFVDIFFSYLEKIKEADFKLTRMDYKPNEYATMSFVKDNVKVNMNYFIKDHLVNKKNYHFD